MAYIWWHFRSAYSVLGHVALHFGHQILRIEHVCPVVQNPLNRVSNNRVRKFFQHYLFQINSFECWVILIQSCEPSALFFLARFKSYCHSSWWLSIVIGCIVKRCFFALSWVISLSAKFLSQHICTWSSRCFLTESVFCCLCRMSLTSISLCIVCIFFLLSKWSDWIANLSSCYCLW